MSNPCKNQVVAPELSLNLLGPFCLAATRRVYELECPEIAIVGKKVVMFSEWSGWDPKFSK